jgi:hypothetical protein
MKTVVINFILLMSLATLSAFPQQATTQDSLLDHMVGKWVLQGIIAGKETTHDIITEWVLGHQYVQIKEVSREKDVNGKPIYEAIVFICWEQKLNRYSCLWLDNTGNGGLSNKAVGHAKANSDKIGLLFKDTDGSLFHTTFAYNRNTDTWQWFMDNEVNGKLQPFALVKLIRR